ncbi:MAG: hypothetical protein GY800_11120 [Planctomycetes bacterium]|nr:hypothetical protein [Planctomycetota bacterium]
MERTEPPARLAPGSDGVDGATDATGAPGSDGADGATGATGAPGSDGADGATGATGAPGSDGADGATGATGAPGSDGVDGAPGVTGAPGSDGADGAPGATGAPGSDGVDGAPGVAGAPGTDGVDGATGEIGATGATGDTGGSGTSSWIDATGQVTTGVNVGIGAVTAPSTALHVDGEITMQGTSETCEAGGAGKIRWSGTDFEGCNGTSWISFTYIPAVVIPTVTSATGRVWMDRNLGASQVATSFTDTAAYGDLYQWGRLADGHETRVPLSSTTGTQSVGDNPGHEDFILATVSPYDWRTPQSGSLWQGASGTNNPCPAGFRLPTEVEWQNEVDYYGATGPDMFNSPLKVVASGVRHQDTGALSLMDLYGFYWSSGISTTYARGLRLDVFTAFHHDFNRGYGFSVRCLKD